MTHIESVAVTAQTFGRDGAMFESLLGFVAQLSVVLWSLVILTVIIRFVGIRIYRRAAARTARVETVAPSAAVSTTAVPTTAAAEKDAVLVPAVLISAELDAVTTATIDPVQPAGAPAAVAASVNVPRRAAHNRRAEPQSAAHLTALASNSTEG